MTNLLARPGRSCVILAAAFSSIPLLAQAQEAPKVAGLFTQTVTQGNWDVGGYDGFAAMAEAEGMDATYLENTSYEAAPAALRSLAADGTDLIIVHSSGYSAAVKEVAPDFPETEFVLYSYEGDTEGLANYSAWSIDWDDTAMSSVRLPPPRVPPVI